MPNRKRKVTEGQRPNKKPKFDKEYTKNFFLPVIFHNLKSYDAHFVIKHFKKQYTARSRDQDDEQVESVSYGDIRVTPLNGKKYLSFQVGNLRFIDTFQFFPHSWTTLCRCC